MSPRAPKSAKPTGLDADTSTIADGDEVPDGIEPIDQDALPEGTETEGGA